MKKSDISIFGTYFVSAISEANMTIKSFDVENKK